MKLEIRNWKLEIRDLILRRRIFLPNFKFQVSSFKPPISNFQFPISNAFTLIELLVVVVILGILFGLLTPALRRAMENAKKQRAETEKVTLKAAIRAYRHEYGRWPCDDGDGYHQAFTNENWKVIDYMTATDGEKNPRQVQFLILSEYRTNVNRAVTDPWGNCYVITLDLTNDTVTVE